MRRRVTLSCKAHGVQPCRDKTLSRKQRWEMNPSSQNEEVSKLAVDQGEGALSVSVCA